MVNRKKSRSRSNEDVPWLPFSEDDCPVSEPAAGNRGSSSLNNAGENGNYWSSSPNEGSSDNAYNLNFNSSNKDLNSNNNRYWGFPVRPVSELTPTDATQPPAAHPYSLTPQQLLLDLYRAYLDARRHKRGRDYQLRFEFHLEENLVQLRDELLQGTYRPGPSTCFIVHDPKMREVFAAGFRDRVVHHLFYNYTHLLLERTFIYDSYSCIPGRGTHFGIERLRHHLRSVSAGYSRPCYVLKLDIRGYFMHINRQRLLQLCRQTLERMRHHRANKQGHTWEEVIDYPFVDRLLEGIATADPTEGSIMLGDPAEWALLPPEKSIVHAPPGCGLPIGNLSSQLFSNVYLGAFDQYVKRVLHCRHYGRYVDDAYIVASSKRQLHRLVPLIAKYLRDELGLELNMDKVRVVDARQGVEFLGAYVRPHRTYVAHRSLRRIRRHMLTMPRRMTPLALMCKVNSWLGVLSHYRCYYLRMVLLRHTVRLPALGRLSSDGLRFRPWGR